jgi:hypothetical protein
MKDTAMIRDLKPHEQELDKQMAIGVLRLLIQTYSITDLLELLIEAVRQERPGGISKTFRECLETGFPGLRQ